MSTRVAFAAAHVAAGPDGEIDWEATLAFRHHLWQLGLGVAEAMDTAQRGMGLDWAAARELIQRTAAEPGDALRPGRRPTTPSRARSARSAPPTSSSASSSRERARRSS